MIGINQRIFPSIRFSPMKYSRVTDFLLVKMIMLDEDDEEERADIRFYSKDIDHLPEVKLELARAFKGEGKQMKYLKALKRAHKEHPENIPIKMQIAIEKLFPFDEESQIKEFRSLFINELNCLFKGKRLDRVISDIDLYELMVILTRYFQFTNKKKHIKQLYVIAKSWGLENIATEIAYIYKDKEMPLGINYYLAGMIEEWSIELLDLLAEYEIKAHPNHEVLYQLLNIPLENLSKEDIHKTQTIEGKEQIKHDLIWLLEQGLVRLKWTPEATNLDFYANAVAIAAEHDMHELTPIFLKFFIEIPVDVHDLIFGDIAHSIIGPPLRKLAAKNISGFKEVLIYRSEQGEYWYVKCVFVTILASLIDSNSETKDEALALFYDLWDEYEENDNVMLGWLMSDIVDFEIDGFDGKIKEAYDKDLIDLFAHGTWEDIQSDKLFRNKDIIKEWKGIEDYYEKAGKKIISLSNSYVTSIDKNISESIKRHETMLDHYGR